MKQRSYKCPASWEQGCGDDRDDHPESQKHRVRSDNKKAMRSHNETISRFPLYEIYRDVRPGLWTICGKSQIPRMRLRLRSSSLRDNETWTWSNRLTSASHIPCCHIRATRDRALLALRWKLGIRAAPSWFANRWPRAALTSAHVPSSRAQVYSRLPRGLESDDAPSQY